MAAEVQVSCCCFLELWAEILLCARRICVYIALGSGINVFHLFQVRLCLDCEAINTPWAIGSRGAEVRMSTILLF